MHFDDIPSLFDVIPPSRDGTWTVREVVPGRVYLGKSVNNEAALFIEGAKDSFGRLPTVSAIQHSTSVTALPSGRKFEALRLTSTNEENGFRIIAHVLYELAWRLERTPQLTNEALITEISWLFGILGGRTMPMAPEKQLGLIGETIFLRRLLRRAHEMGIDIHRALSCWAGGDLAKRDFYGGKTAVEVKTTGHVTRLHHIASLDQLAPQEKEEDVFLYSIGIRTDPTAPKKLTHFINDVEVLLVDEKGNVLKGAVGALRKQLHAYGFDWGDRDLYERQPGFLAPHLPPEMYAAKELNYLSVKHFVGGAAPETVRAISYSLEVVARPIPHEGAQKVCDRMLGIEIP